MGSRQRPPGGTKGGNQARAEQSGAQRKAAAADQRKQEEETLADAREDVDGRCRARSWQTERAETSEQHPRVAQTAQPGKSRPVSARRRSASSRSSAASRARTRGSTATVPWPTCQRRSWSSDQKWASTPRKP